MRTLIVGIEGASWSILEPLLERGLMPNLARLRDGGARGVLESTLPFGTSAAWASYATGVAPDRHGLRDDHVVEQGGALRSADHRDRRGSTYLETLGRAGGRSVVVNLPVDLRGCAGTVVVNSWLTADDRYRLLPLGRRERYGRLLQAYRVAPRDPSDLDELCRIVDARFDLARELFLSEAWDHFFLLFSAPDSLTRQLVGGLARGDAGAIDALARLYTPIDRRLGWLAERAADAVTIVVSAFGHAEERAVVRVNGLLEQLGLASPAAREDEADPRLRASIRIPAALSRRRFDRPLRPLAVRANRGLRRGLKVELSAALRRVDLARSSAYCPTDAAQSIYVRDGAHVRVEEIREALLSLHLPAGDRALANVWTHEELYGRPAVDDGPALVLEPARGVRLSSLLKDAVVDLPPAEGAGCRSRDGIVLFAGPGIAPGELGRVSILDLAPTLMYAAGLRRPFGGDGRPLVEAFDPALAGGGEHAAGDVPVEDIDLPSELEHRLKALGYI